jgi:hypothetical protein
MFGSKLKQPLNLYLKFVFFAAGAAVTLFTYFWLIGIILKDRIGNWDYQLSRFHRELIQGDYPNLENLDILVIGDSTAVQNIVASNFGQLKAASIATNGVGAVEMYYALKRYLESPLERRVPPKCILLMTSYGAHEFHQAEGHFWRASIGLGILSTADAIDYYREAAKLSAWPSSEFSLVHWLARVLISKIKPNVNFDIMQRMVILKDSTLNFPINAYRIIRRSNGAGPTEVYFRSRNKAFDSPNQAFLKQPFSPVPILDFYLKKIFDLAKKRGIKLHILYGPLAQSVRTSESEAWLRVAFSHIAQLSEGYENVQSDLQALWMADYKFNDASHLKWSSASKYSAELAQKLTDCRSN